MEKFNFKPDLLTFEDGTRVENIRDWELRRNEILDILCREEYGYSPEKPTDVRGTITDRNEKCCSGHAVLESIDISFTAENGQFTFPIKFFAPKDGKKHPLIMLINFRSDSYDMYCPTEEIIDNGFALAIIYHNDITKDLPDRSGLAGMYTPKFGDASWGKLGMWAFGISRALDYLETRPEVDTENVTVAGHSRLGKTALWCAAQDERFKFAISNDSGCGGAALEKIKHEGGETIEDMERSFPYWFCRNRSKYVNRADKMPFDQHFLLAAIAPRYVAVGSASLDNWADQYSEQLACAAASPAWEIHNKPGFVGTMQPAKIGDSFSDGSISYHMRDGIHYFGRADWLEYMRFIKKNI